MIHLKKKTYLLTSERYYPADELAAIREQKAYEAERREERRLALEARKQKFSDKRQG